MSEKVKSAVFNPNFLVCWIELSCTHTHTTHNTLIHTQIEHNLEHDQSLNLSFACNNCRSIFGTGTDQAHPNNRPGKWCGLFLWWWNTKMAMWAAACVLRCAAGRIVMVEWQNAWCFVHVGICVLESKCLLLLCLPICSLYAAVSLVLLGRVGRAYYCLVHVCLSVCLPMQLRLWWWVELWACAAWLMCPSGVVLWMGTFCVLCDCYSCEC